jgi:hypothetical protein
MFSPQIDLARVSLEQHIDERIPPHYSNSVLVTYVLQSQQHH